MKKVIQKLALSLCLATALSWGTAMADDHKTSGYEKMQKKHHGMMEGKKSMQRGHQGMRGSAHNPLQMVLMYQMHNTRVALLAEMSGESVESIKAKVEVQSFHKVMKSLKIDKKAYAEKMHGKVKGLITQAGENGTITAAQASSILELMALGPNMGNPGNKSMERTKMMRKHAKKMKKHGEKMRKKGEAMQKKMKEAMPSGTEEMPPAEGENE